MTTKTLGRGLSMALIVLAVVGLPTMTAYADATCYVGCTPPTTIQTGGGGGPGTGSGGGGKSPVTKSSGGGSGASGSSGANAKTTSQSTSSSGGSLPFTGADVEEMAGMGIGALGIGGVLVRRSRQRRRAQV